MPSGMHEVQINNTERAVHDDVVRLQKFKAQDLGELFRYLLDVTGDDDLNPGVITEYTTVGTPLRAEIINGLMAAPVAATLTVNVTEGIIYALAPDGDTDVSNYKFVHQPAGSSVALAANASGTTRLDVIECRVNPTDATVAAVRDVFSTVTGTFTATSVTKERKGQLQFQVRSGAAGAMPALVSGWLPIAVALVPNGATSNDNIVFWDVRPLVSDRAFQPMATSLARPRAWNRADIMDFSVLATARGIVDSTLGSRRLGGQLRAGNDAGPVLTPDATNTNVLDLTNALNRSSGFALVAYQLAYLYLCTPFGLPRWARYTTGPANRVPRSPRGIPILSTIAPNAAGNPLSNIAMPAGAGSWNGVGVVLPAEAVCIATLYNDNTSVFRGFYGDDRSGVIFGGPRLILDGAAVNFPLIVSTDVLAGTQLKSSFTLTPNVHYPAHAREILLEFTIYVTVAAVTDNIYTSLAIDTAGAGGVPFARLSTSAGIANSARRIPVYFSVWVPLPNGGYPSVTPLVQNFEVLSEGNITAAGNSAVQVRGYKL